MLDTKKQKSDFDKILSDIDTSTKTSKTPINYFECNERDASYTRLLKNYISDYINKSRDNRNYKKWFFRIIMVVFCAVIFGSIASMICISLKGEINLSSLGMIIASVASIISVVVVLPKVIAEHLFPKDAETHIINLVERMQEHDTQIRNTNKTEK